MRLSDLQGRRLVVLGLGDDVSAALGAVVAAGPADVHLVDADPHRASARLRAEHPGLAGNVPVLGRLEDAPSAEVALRSPGFCLYQPELARRTGAGLVTTTPLDLWVNERGEGPMVVVTGTKGKSSTAVLVSEALRRLGHPALVLANIGVPPWTVSPGVPEVAVLEVSSYQAADLSRTAPIGALTAIGEDHVNWHGSLERYLADKARTFLAPAGGERRWYGVPDDIVLPPAFVPADLVPVRTGSHDVRRRNAVLAAATALALTGPKADRGHLAGQLLDGYPQLPGRMSLVARVAGVDYVDDSLASNPLGLAAALRSTGDRVTTVIVGGHDRGVGAGAAVQAARERSVRAALVWLDEGNGLAEALSPWCTSARAAGSLEEAVALGASLTPRGGTVVFSPGMPTPEDQGNWATRSARFRRAVEGLAGAPEPA